MRSILPLLLLAAAVGPVAAAEAPELLPELRYAPPDSWIGQSRKEIVAKWGEPLRVKQHKDGSATLVFERKVLLGAAYADVSSVDVDMRKEKDAEGRGRLVAETEADAPVDLVFKKMKFKFRLGPDGRVTRIEFPSKLAEDPATRTHAPPRAPAQGASPYRP